MAIEPNTTIKVYHGVPLDMNQDRSIAWANISEQNTYFHANNSNILKYTFSQTTYQRVRKGVMRVERKADDLYDCNYMAFQNTNFGNKWFYAFITSVEYVNDITSEVTFVIDELQTWFFEMTLQPCMIERCHTTTDVIGEHIEPEPVQLGEYVFNFKTQEQGGQVVEVDGYKPMADILTSLIVVIAIVDISAADKVKGNLYDGIYGGAELWAFQQTDVTGINNKIKEYITKPESIIGIYMCPKVAAGYSTGASNPPSGGEAIPTRQLMSAIRVSRPAITSTDMIDGYTPKNKKLYTYPYNYFHVDNSMGSSLCLRYEFFTNLAPVFEINGTVTQPVEFTIRPYAYKNTTPIPQATPVFEKTLNTEVLTLTTFPTCSWNNDGFQAWVVNAGIPYGINIIGGAIDMLTGLAMAGAVGAGGGGLAGLSGEAGASGAGMNIAGSVGGFGIGKKAAGLANAFYQASIQSDISRGNFSNASVDCTNSRHQFYGGRLSITAEYARIIDDFFDKYGYAISRLQTPNLRARPHWTYIQTKECSLTGNLPTSAKENIKRFFNSGITFWKVPSEVGNYTLNNRV